MNKNPATLGHTPSRDQETTHHWRNPTAFVLNCLKSLQYQSYREYLRKESSYIRSPTSLNKREGEYIEVCIQKYLKNEVISEENIFYICIDKADEKLLQV